MNGRLAFDGYSPSIILVAAVCAAAIVFFVYWHETRGYAFAVRAGLPLLRITALGLILFLLTQPYFEKSTREGTLGEVIFAVDSSASMLNRDDEVDTPRLERVERLLEDKVVGIVRQLTSTHDVLVESDEGDLRITDLALLLNSAASSSPSQSQDTLRTIVLVSDGRNTSGASPREAAEKLSAAGFEISTWGFGNQDEPDDLAILDVEHPDRVSATGRVRGTIRYKSVMKTPQPVLIELRERSDDTDGVSGNVVWKEVISPDAVNRGSVDFEFPIKQLALPKPKGLSSDQYDQLMRIQLKAEIRLASNDDFVEQDSANNSRMFSLLALQSEYQILIVDGRSRWETRYLKNLFSRDPQWVTTTFIRHPDIGLAAQKDRLQAVPRSLNELLEFDVVYLAAVDRSALEPSFWQLLVEYVARGGGLVLVDDSRGDLVSVLRGEQSSLLPVTYQGAAKPFYADSLQLTTAGNSAPWLSLEEDSAGPNEWNLLPPPRAMRLTKAEENSEVLVEAVLGGQIFPFIVSRQFGGGRIIYFASDETWRWRYKQADVVHSRFWNQLALALIQPPLVAGNQFAELDADKAEYRAGEKALLRVRLKNPDGTYNEAASVDAMLYSKNELVQSVALRPSTRLPGLYEGETLPLGIGDYVLKFAADGYGESASDMAVKFNVIEGLSDEQLLISQDRKMLEEIAQSGRGEYFSEHQRDDLLRYLADRTDGRIVSTRFRLWDNYFAFIPIITLLVIEWWVRKRVGLP